MQPGTSTVSAPAKPRAKTAFRRWLFENDYTLRAAAEALGCSHEHVRRICLHPDDEGQRLPDEDLVRRIETLTRGEITKTDFPAPPASEGSAAQ